MANNLFDNILHADESLFINPIALDLDYLPKLLPYREDQQFYIASCLKPLFQKRNGKNILITGSPGIGKTAACRFVLRELEQKTDEIIPIYINCWKKDSAYKIALDICDQLGYRWTHNKNTNQLLDEISSILNKKSAVFVFDEVDKLESEQIIYSLIEDINRKSIILITNETSWYNDIDDRVKSRLALDHVSFEPYNYDETKGILKQRIEYAFVPNVWEDEALEEISLKAYKLKDLRVGISLLKESGDIAEFHCSRKVKLDHAKEAIAKLDKIKLNQHELPVEDKKILELIKKYPNLSTTDLYNEYFKLYNKSLRTFQRKLKTLSQLKLITLKEEHNPSGGRMIKVELNKD